MTYGGEYAYYYCLGLLLCVVVGYAGMDCKIGRVRSRISNCNIELSVNDLPSFSGHEDITSFCKDLECTIKCYIDAIGDCYKEDACFMYNPGVYKVTSRAICSNPNETSLALVACQWKDHSCLKTFQKAVDSTQLNMNGDNEGYKTSYCNALVDLTSCVDFAIRDSCTDKLANIMNDIYKASLSYTACGIEEHPYFSTYEGDVTCRGNSVHWTVNTFISTLIILAVECSIWNQNCLNT